MTTSKRRDTPLTRDELLEAALRIVDEEGLDALTMRRLADAVGVEAMSLYHHVPNKEALLDGVVERVMTGMRLPDPLPEDWMDLFEAMFAELRRALEEHPDVMPLLARRPPVTPAAAPYMQVPLRILAEQGLGPDEAVALYRSLLAFTFGYSMLGATMSEARAPLADHLAERLRTWDDETYRRTVRAILESYAGKPAA